MSWSRLSEFWKLEYLHLEKKKLDQHQIEAATGGVLQEIVLLKISQNSQENTCASVSFLIKLQALTPLGDCFW